MRRTSARVSVVVVLASLAFLLGSAVPALAKSYSMPSVTIHATVNTDGSVRVREERVFDFRGSFTWVLWKLDTAGSDGIRIDGVRGPEGSYAVTPAQHGPSGSYLDWADGAAAYVRIFRDSTDEEVTFTIDYTVLGAAKRYADTAELYWQFVGDESEVGVGSVRIDVSLPPDIAAGSINAYAHGPLTGVVAPPAESLASFTVEDLPPYTFVETRVLFPASALGQAATIPQARLEEAVAEETRWAEEANAQRRAAQRRVALAAVLGGVVPILAALGALILWWRHGRERKPLFPGGYYRELPSDLAPAIVGALWRFGTIGDPETVATVMDLTNRGVITIERVTETKQRLLGLLPDATNETYQLSLAEAAARDLAPFEQKLVDLLFRDASDDGTLTMSELKAWAKAYPEAFTSSMAEWKAGVSDAARRQGFFEKTGGGLKWVLVAGSVLVATLGFIMTGMIATWWPGVIGFVAAGVIMALGFGMPRRTAEANELYWKYRGLRDYLRDFSRLNEAPPTHVALWEHFIVMAVVFGIAEQVIEALRVRIPEILNDPSLARTAWWVTSPQTGGMSPASALTSGFASASQIATSQMSSGSGGGGGFSGGGGGGGGGGGVSAG